MIDPYPTDLIDDLEPLTQPDPMVRAMNRLAEAIEQLVLATLDKPAQSATIGLRPALAPLPAVTVVAQKPPCPFHGIAKVFPSSKFPGFYCTAKDQSKPRGYCDWTLATA